MNHCPGNLRITLLVLFGMAAAGAAGAATNATTNAWAALPPPPGPRATAREFYNAGTGRLLAARWDDAETLLASAVARQDERLQPGALYNLGHARFAQGAELLKKSPDGAATIQHGLASVAGGDEAIQRGETALAGTNLQQLVEAYLDGRGARRDLTAATKAVQRALEKYGQVLVKWRRSLSDFQGAAELNPADTNSTHNAEVVEQAIARLVDKIQEMQQLAAGLGGKKSELDKMLKQLKGRIPAPDMPPGAPGDQTEDDDGDNGRQPSPESLAGREETDNGGGGQELGLRLSPEQAGQLMNSLQPGTRTLPTGQGEAGPPKDRSGRIW